MFLKIYYVPYIFASSLVYFIINKLNTRINILFIETCTITNYKICFISFNLLFLYNRDRQLVATFGLPKLFTWSVPVTYFNLMKLSISD